MSSYAQGTSSSVLVSQADIMKVLARLGVMKHAFMNDVNHSAIHFEYYGLSYRFVIALPDRADFCASDTGRARTQQAAFNAWDAEVKRRWRSLLLVIKAKLVAVEDRIATFEQEFMPYMVTDTGQTVYERFEPSIQKALGSGAPLALPGGKP